RAAGHDLLRHRFSIRRVAAEPQRDFHVLVGRAGDAAVKANFFVQAQGKPARKLRTGQGDDGNAEGQRVAARIASPEMKRVEDDVGSGDVLQELAVLRAGNEAYSRRERTERELEAPAQLLGDARRRELQQHELGWRVALEEGPDRRVEIRMDLEEVLRTVVEVLAGGRSEEHTSELQS